MKTVKNENQGEVLATMYHYAYLDANDVVDMIISLPSQIQDRQYISIATADQSLVGKKYNRVTGEFEDIMFYYALLDAKDIVTDVVALPSQVTDPKKISVPTYDKSIVGKWYNRSTGLFQEVPIHVLAKVNTGEINVLKADGTQEDKWLDSKLKEIDDKLVKLGQESFGGYKTRFTIRDNVETTAEWIDGKAYTFHFETGIPGYFPKMIRLVCSKGYDETLVADIYIVRNADGTVKHSYLDKTYIGIPVGDSGVRRTITEHDVSLNWGAFLVGKDSSGKGYDTGGSAFIQELYKSGADVSIDGLTYTENTISFTMTANSEAIGQFTRMSIGAYIF